VRAGEGQRPVLSRSPWRLMAAPSLSAQRLGARGLDPATFRPPRAPPSPGGRALERRGWAGQDRESDRPGLRAAGSWNSTFPRGFSVEF
jgi:hypothetical protein